MAGLASRLCKAAAVNADIDEYRTGTACLGHGVQVLAWQEVRCGGTRYVDRADDHVRTSRDFGELREISRRQRDHAQEVCTAAVRRCGFRCMRQKQRCVPGRLVAGRLPTPRP